MLGNRIPTQKTNGNGRDYALYCKAFKALPPIRRNPTQLL